MKKKEIAEQIALENAKERTRLTKDDVYKYMKTAITKSPKQMIDLLVKEIKLYNDKVEIFFKYNRRPQEETSTTLTVHSEKQEIIVGNEQKKVNLDINCLI